MTKQEFFDLLNNLEHAGQQDIDQLEDVLKEYPYFQVVPILQAKIASGINAVSRDKRITKAALFTADRSNLKRLIEDRIVLAQPAIEEKRTSEVMPVEKETTLAEEVQKIIEEIKKPAERSASDALYDEVMKNLQTLKSLREKYEFLDEQEQEQEKAARSVEQETLAAGEETGEKTKKEEKAAQKKQETKKGAKTSATRRKKKEIVEQEEKPEEPEEDTSSKIDIEEQNSLIESFIKNESQFSRKQPDVNMENKNDLSEKSTTISDEIVSENLALIMLSQGKADKAIEIYKKLIWKFPQKKAYFASRIEELNNK